MRIGMIGLGRMGSNMARRLLAAGHDCVVYDRSPETVKDVAGKGRGANSGTAVPADSLADLVSQLRPPRVVWLMIPAAAVDKTLDEIPPLLEEGDVVVDGGNSYYRDDVRRSKTLAGRGLHYLDVGVSGGVWGREGGYCLMIGGPAEAVRLLEPIFQALAPGVEAAPRTEGRDGEPTPAEKGYLHCGAPGAGHFVKMVHNGIEYGLMAAYAEGLNILRHADAGGQQRQADAETAPMRDPEYYRYELDLPQIAEVWRRGSVIRSWLLDLTAHSLSLNPELSDFSGRVSDSGEGRWTMKAAVDEGVPAPILAVALAERFASRDREDFASRILSAMRWEFGGHEEKSS